MSRSSNASQPDSWQLTHCSVLCNARVRFTWPPISPGVVESIFTQGIIELCVYQYNRDADGLGVDVLTGRISIQTTPYKLVTVPTPRCSNVKHFHLVSTVGIPKVDWDIFPNLLSMTCDDSLNRINHPVMSLSQHTKNGCACPLLETIYLCAGLGRTTTWSSASGQPSEYKFGTKNVELLIGTGVTTTRLRSNYDWHCLKNFRWRLQLHFP